MNNVFLLACLSGILFVCGYRIVEEAPDIRPIVGPWWKHWGLYIMWTILSAIGWFMLLISMSIAFSIFYPIWQRIMES